MTYTSESCMPSHGVIQWVIQWFFAACWKCFSAVTESVKLTPIQFAVRALISKKVDDFFDFQI